MQIRQPSIKELGHFSLEVVANNYRSGCKWIRIYRSGCKWIKIQAILFMVARSIPKNYRNVTGRFASAKNQNLIGFESTLEKDFFLLLEFDRRVESFEEQPVTITYRGLEGRVCHYTPDALVRYQAALAGEPDWRPVLYEVKYRSDLREHGVEYRPKFKAARRYARDRGWRFRVVTEREIRTSRLSNIRFLLRYRRMRVDDQDRDALLATLRKQGPLKPPTLLALTYPDSCR